MMRAILCSLEKRKIEQKILSTLSHKMNETKFGLDNIKAEKKNILILYQKMQHRLREVKQFGT